MNEHEINIRLQVNIHPCFKFTYEPNQEHTKTQSRFLTIQKYIVYQSKFVWCNHFHCVPICLPIQINWWCWMKMKKMNARHDRILRRVYGLRSMGNLIPSKSIKRMEISFEFIKSIHFEIGRKQLILCVTPSFSWLVTSKLDENNGLLTFRYIFLLLIWIISFEIIWIFNSFKMHVRLELPMNYPIPILTNLSFKWMVKRNVGMDCIFHFWMKTMIFVFLSLRNKKQGILFQ